MSSGSTNKIAETHKTWSCLNYVLRFRKWIPSLLHFFGLPPNKFQYDTVLLDINLRILLIL